MLKDYFRQANIPFVEKLVDQDEAAREEMTKVSGGFLGVPFSVITQDDGTSATIVGFDKGKIDQALALREQPATNDFRQL
jgi:hypothetical protein